LRREQEEEALSTRRWDDRVPLARIATLDPGVIVIVGRMRLLMSLPHKLTRAANPRR